MLHLFREKSRFIRFEDSRDSMTTLKHHKDYDHVKPVIAQTCFLLCILQSTLFKLLTFSFKSLYICH